MTIVRFDPPSLRKHDRVTAPASVILEDVVYATLQWSAGGFCIHGYRGSARPGDQHSVRFILNFHGFEVGFNTMVEVCRVEPDHGTLAARYLDLGEREKELLKHFLSGLVSGQIGAIGDTIRHLDLPLYSLPAPVGQEERGRSWRHTRHLATRSLLYLVVGPMLLIFAALAIYRSFFRLEVQTAVVARPIESLVSLGTGRVDGMYVREGASVTAGQKLFSVDDDVIRREVEEARFDRDRARAEVGVAQTGSRAARERLEVYKHIAARKQTVAAGRVTALTAECDAAHKQLERARALVATGLEGEAILDQPSSDYARLKGALEEASAELEIARDAVRAAESGSFYDGFRLVEDGPQLQAGEGARVKVRLAEERLADAEHREGLLTCRAPFAGSVVRVVKSEGATVGRGEEVVFVEHSLEPPRIQALLSQGEVSEVKVGARVTVQIPALGRNFLGTVEHVDRANLLANPLLTHPALRPAWGASAERSAWMSVALPQLTPAERASLQSGMPAVVTLGKEQAAIGWHNMFHSAAALTR